MDKFERFRNNKLKTREDIQQLAKDLVNPTDAYFDPDYPGHLDFGGSGTVYPKETQEVEGFLRPLWAIAPLLSDPDQDLPIFKEYQEGLLAGTDPDNKAYFGKMNNGDQLMVEATAMALTLVLTKERFWDTLKDKQKQNIHDWLIQINHHSLPNSNWHYFRVLVNMAMSLLGMDYSKDMMEFDFSAIDSFYVSDGWYTDGPFDKQDYYISWAIQFYGLVYAKLYGDKDPKRATKLKKRAGEFAKTYQYWYDADGSGIPYGRSLIYRFAQVAFWSAVAYSGVDTVPLGVVKHIILQNLRYWMKQDIFRQDGTLNLGYAYENLNFTEGYNGPGSPYWALKSFLILALPKDHKFWSVKEEVPRLDQKISVPAGRMLITRDADGNNVQGFTAGQLGKRHSHCEAKYSKLVYSTRFAFSTPKDGIMLNEQAYDSTLALCEDGDHHYRTRERVEAFRFNSDFVYSMWLPWKDVQVKTYVIPVHPWHIRVHYITTTKQLKFADNGFANEIKDTSKETQTTKGAYVFSDRGVTGAEEISGPFTLAKDLRPEPNTNLLFPRSSIPVLYGVIPVGTTVIIDAFLGSVKAGEEKEVPEASLDGDTLTIKYQGETKKILLESNNEGQLGTTTG